MKNKIKFLLNTIIFTIIITANIVYAENNTLDNITTNITNTTENTTLETNATTNTTREEKTDVEEKEEEPDKDEKVPQTTKKSSDANLKNLGIRPHDFTGFKPGTTKYKVTVPYDTESIEVYAVTKDSKSKVSGTGTKKLDEGENEFEVIVTAEDGTTKIYTISVIREAEEIEEETENTESVQTRYSGDGLSSLKITDIELSPSFDTIIYEYTAKYIGEETELEIETETTDPYYEVEVIGNKELQEGENIITILVSDPDGENVATYQIIVNKSLVDEEAIAREETERKQEEQRTIIIIVGVVIGIVGIIIFLMVRSKRKNNIWAEEYAMPYEGIEKENSQLEDYDSNMNYIREKDVDNLELTKDEAKEEFLNNYNMEDNEEEIVKKKRHKGKRFK